MKTEEENEPMLPDWSKESPFRVPEGYFDRFPMKISDRIAVEKKHRKFPFPVLLKPAPMFATTVVILSLGILGIRQLSKPADPLSTEEISNYVYQEGILDDLSEEELLEFTDLGLDEADSLASDEAAEILNEL
jgi:hypothetical protein